MIIILRTIAGLFIVLFLTGTALSAPVAWTVDPAHSGIYFDIRHIVSTVRGHFDDFTGKVMIDEGNKLAGSTEFEAKVKSINTNNSKRDTHLCSEDFFDATQFPTIRFRSKSIKPIRDHQFEMVGDLTVKGVTKEITVPFTFLGIQAHPMDAKKQVAGFEGKFTIDRLDFGVGNGTYYRTGLVGKTVHLMISFEAVKKQ